MSLGTGDDGAAGGGLGAAGGGLGAAGGAARPAGSVRERLIVALDQPDLSAALAHVDRIGDAVAWYKVGLQLFCAAGREGVQAVADRGKRIFLDLKLHDIPATVEKAILALDRLPVSLVTVHAAGGPAMLEAAARAARSIRTGGTERAGPLGNPAVSGRVGRPTHAGPRVVGVTMLTSLDGTEAPALWNPVTSLQEKVLSLAAAAAAAGLDGVVASPRELAALRVRHAPPFVIVTPGIRGPKDSAQDQKRTMSLPEAFAAGADYVVVGRPILESDDPRAVVATYEASLAGAP